MKRETVLRPHGYAVWSGGDKKDAERDCLQCCHCAMHFYVVKGSGRRRGYCMCCMAVTCGKAVCNPCLPWKKRMELFERGKAPLSIIVGRGIDHDRLPVSARVEVEPPKSPGGVYLG